MEMMDPEYFDKCDTVEVEVEGLCKIDALVVV